MIDVRIKEAIVEIINRERDRASVDWAEVESIASKIIDYINENEIKVDNVLYNFLEDADARRKSERYSSRKTREVRILLGLQ